MEFVDVVALAHFADSRVGSVTRKQRIQIGRADAERLEVMGLVTIQSPKAEPKPEPKTEPELMGEKGPELHPVEEQPKPAEAPKWRGRKAK